MRNSEENAADIVMKRLSPSFREPFLQVRQLWTPFRRQRQILFSVYGTLWGHPRKTWQALFCYFTHFFGTVNDRGAFVAMVTLIMALPFLFPKDFLSVRTACFFFCMPDFVHELSLFLCEAVSSNLSGIEMTSPHLSTRYIALTLSS